jgi:hypothetical protein
MPAVLSILRDPYSEQPDIPTLGVMTADGLGPVVQTLEPPWRQNRANVSCIPEGEYGVVMVYSARFGKIMPHLIAVPEREAVEIHVGNFPRDTHGCILTGMVRGTDGWSIYRSMEALGIVLGWLARALADGPVVCRITRAPAAASKEAVA